MYILFNLDTPFGKCVYAGFVALMIETFIALEPLTFLLILVITYKQLYRYNKKSPLHNHSSKIYKGYKVRVFITKTTYMPKVYFSKILVGQTR